MSVVVVPGNVRGGQVEEYAPGVPMTATVGAAQSATGGLLAESMAGDRVVRTAQVTSMICVGVLLWDAAAGVQVAVAWDGVWFLTASGAIGAGNKIITGAAGVAVVAGATPDARSLVGRAIADISNAQQGPCLIRP
jgi:Uncharacterized conserved protein (DUF2190)